MANNGFIQVPPDSTGKKVDGISLTSSGQAVIRQKVAIGGAGSADTVLVTAGALLTTLNGIGVSSSAIAVQQHAVTLPGINITASSMEVTVKNASVPTFIVGFSGTSLAVNIVNFAASAGSLAVSVGNALTLSGVDLSSSSIAVRAINTINTTLSGVDLSLSSIAVRAINTVTVNGGVGVSAIAGVVSMMDTANLALRVNVVAGGAGGGTVVIGTVSAGVVFPVVGISGTAVSVAMAGVNISSSSLMVTVLGVNVSGSAIAVQGSVVLGGVDLSLSSIAVRAINTIAITGTTTIGAISTGVVLPVNIGAISSGVVLPINIGAISSGVVLPVSIVAQSAGHQLVVEGPVAFNASVTAGNQPVLIGGRVKLSASATATSHSAVNMWFDKLGRQVVAINHPSLAPSGTHGPRAFTLTGTAQLAIASAGTAAIYVDSIMVTNGTSAIRTFIAYEGGTSGSPGVACHLAASGGGFQHAFNPPWRISPGQALNCGLDITISTGAAVFCTIHFHTGVD